MKNMLVALMMTFTITITQAAEIKSTGWEPIQGKDLITTKITNIGNKGGLITVGCEKKGDPIKVTYTYNGQPVDMFIVETLGEGRDVFPFVSIYGLNSMNTDMVMEQVEHTDQGFIINRFENGERERYKATRKTGEKSTPIPIGNELFVGYEHLGEYIADIKEVCGKSETRKF